MILMLDLKETYFSNKNFIYGAFFKNLCYKVLYESGITQSFVTNFKKNPFFLNNL